MGKWIIDAQLEDVGGRKCRLHVDASRGDADLGKPTNFFVDLINSSFIDLPTEVGRWTVILSARSRNHALLYDLRQILSEWARPSNKHAFSYHRVHAVESLLEP